MFIFYYSKYENHNKNQKDNIHPTDKNHLDHNNDNNNGSKNGVSNIHYHDYPNNNIKEKNNRYYDIEFVVCIHENRTNQKNKNKLKIINYLLFVFHFRKSKSND